MIKSGSQRGLRSDPQAEVPGVSHQDAEADPPQGVPHHPEAALREDPKKSAKTS